MIFRTGWYSMYAKTTFSISGFERWISFTFGIWISGAGWTCPWGYALEPGTAVLVGSLGAWVLSCIHKTGIFNDSAREKVTGAGNWIILINVQR